MLWRIDRMARPMEGGPHGSGGWLACGDCRGTGHLVVDQTIRHGTGLSWRRSPRVTGRRGHGVRLAARDVPLHCASRTSLLSQAPRPASPADPEGLCAPLLDVRRAGGRGRRGRDPVSLGLHAVHVGARLEGHRRDAVRRPGELCQDAEDERFLWAIVRTLWFTAASVIAPVLLGVWAAVCFASQVQAARARAHAVRAADDGDAGGDRAGVDHDVPPAAWAC